MLPSKSKNLRLYVLLASPRWCKLAACSQFKIQNSLPVPLVPPVLLVPLVSPVPPVPAFSALPILPAFSTLPPVSPVPLVPLVPQFIIPFALFRAHYRLKKLFSLWWVKRNSGAILLYCIDC